MAGFGEGAPFGRGYLIMNGQTLEADVAYQQIYGLAKKSVFVVDNYICVKTLLHLRHVGGDVVVTLFSDNVGKFYGRRLDDRQLSLLADKKVVGLVALQIRVDYWDNGSLVRESIASGDLLYYLQELQRRWMAW